MFCEGAAGVAQHGELSWEEPVHFPVNKNSSGFVILRYLKVFSCSLFWFLVLVFFFSSVKLRCCEIKPVLVHGL